MNKAKTNERSETNDIEPAAPTKRHDEAFQRQAVEHWRQRDQPGTPIAAELGLRYFIDPHPAVRAFAKNAGLGFAIPYLHNGQMHDYQPDFIIQRDTPDERYLILETKGYDPLEDVKQSAAQRWCAAVNADGRHGLWSYAVVKKPTEVTALLADSAKG